MNDEPNAYPIERAPSHGEAMVLDYASAPAAAPETGVDPVKVVRRALHGRYLLTGALALVLGGVGAYLGYTLPPIKFMSQGVINIQPTKPVILNQLENNRATPMFPQYVDSQVTIIKSRRVIDMAMESQAWRDLGRGTSPAEIAAFGESLAVTHRYRTQTILVQFVDLDPKAAQVATTEVLHAYMKVNGETESHSGLMTLDILRKELAKENRKVDSLNGQIFALTDEKGAPALESNYGTLVQRSVAIRQAQQDAEVEIASLEAQLKAAAERAGDETIPDKTAEEIAFVDGRMADLLTQKTVKEAEIERLRRVRGAGRNDPELSRLVVELGAIERRIAQRTELYNRTSGGTVDGRETELLQKRVLLGRLNTLLELTEAQLKGISGKKHQILGLADQITAAKARISEINARISAVDLESETPGRIQVVAEGFLPVAPHEDKRPVFAAGAGAGGAGLALLLMLLLGVANRKVRHLIDMDEEPATTGRFLGVLPDLPEYGETQTENAQMAEHCIHHTRTMLQLHNTRGGAVTAITSAIANSGKTTLTLALGLSYGATGRRTLLIDADLVGRGLTSSIKAMLRGRVNRMLDQSGDTSAAFDGDEAGQLLDLMADALRRNGTSIPMSDLFDRARMFPTRTGAASEIERLLQLLEAQDGARDRRAGASTGTIRRAILSGDGVDNRSAGLLEALCGAPLRDCVVRTGVANVHVLTTGGADARDASTLSPEAIAALLDACRQEYDTVLIDTGPILGSLEAHLVTVAADSVLVTVSRGDERPLNAEAMTQLKSLGANVAGVIFNRADIGEVRRSNFSSQWRSQVDA